MSPQDLPGIDGTRCQESTIPTADIDHNEERLRHRETVGLSVVVGSFGRREFLIDAVKSVLNQTLDYRHYEIIVAKDFDDVDIDRWLDSLGVRRLRTAGRPAGRWLREVCQLAEGSVVSLLDDDDLFSPRKLEEVLRVFRRDEQLVYFHNGISRIDSLGNSLPGRGYERRWKLLPDSTRVTQLSKRSSLMRVVASRGDYNSSSISFRKDLVKRDLTTLDTIEASIDSYLFFSALASAGTLLFGLEPLTLLRIHTSSWSGEGAQDLTELNERIPGVLERHIRDYDRISEMLRRTAALEYLPYLAWCRVGAKARQKLCSISSERRVTAQLLAQFLKVSPSGPLRESFALSLLLSLSMASPYLALSFLSALRVLNQ